MLNNNDKFNSVEELENLFKDDLLEYRSLLPKEEINNSMISQQNNYLIDENRTQFIINNTEIDNSIKNKTYDNVENLSKDISQFEFKLDYINLDASKYSYDIKNDYTNGGDI